MRPNLVSCYQVKSSRLGKDLGPPESLRPRIRKQGTSYEQRSTGRRQVNVGVCFSLILIILGSISLVQATVQTSASSKSQNQSQVSQRVGRILANGGSRLARTIESSAKAGGQLNDWLMHQVAPVMATKLIDNILQVPGKSKKSSDSSQAIDTHALADKIVDKVADSIKKRRASGATELSVSKSIDTAKAQDNLIQTDDSANEKEADSHELMDDEKSGAKNRNSKGSNRRGKSLVGDSVHQVMQNLLSKDPSRNLFARAMEKSRNPLRNHHGSQSSQPWLASNIMKQVEATTAATPPNQHDQQFFSVSTDRSQLLDENPVILRDVHGHNNFSSNSGIRLQVIQSRNKLQQNKYVHTNRHQQPQGLAPKPWTTNNHGLSSNRRSPQHQSPYSYPVTSDINIVQASSPAPLPEEQPQLQPITTTTSTTTTPASIHLSSSQFVPQNNIHQQFASSHKFKLSNSRHQPASSWNRGSYHPNRQPSTTSTTTTTTTTTTTEPPPPPTESLTEAMESILDLDQNTSSPVSSILSSVAQSSFDALNQIGSESMSSNSESTIPSSASLGSSNRTRGYSGSTARHSITTNDAIPTALGAPLYHLSRANFTVTSIMTPPPRRASSSPVASVAVQYLQKGLKSLSSTIFSRQNKNWARRLGLSSVFLSGLLYGASVLANPGAPMPTNGLEGKFPR